MLPVGRKIKMEIPVKVWVTLNAGWMRARTLSEIPESSQAEEADDKAKQNEDAPLETHR